MPPTQQDTQQEPSLHNPPRTPGRLRTANLDVCGVTEAGEVLGLSRSQVNRLVWAGHLPADDIAVPTTDGGKHRPLFVMARRAVFDLRDERATAERRRAQRAESTAHARPGGQA